MLIGSLSNDLYRVASLAHRGSKKAAIRFLNESKRWVNELSSHKLERYITNIIQDLESDDTTDISEERAEKLLMYSVLLQNYALHTK